MKNSAAVSGISSTFFYVHRLPGSLRKCLRTFFAGFCLWWMPFGLYAQCEDIKAAHDQKFRWMETRQLDSLATILHEGLTYVHSNGWMESRQEVLDNLASRHLVYDKVDHTILKCTLAGDAGIIHGEGSFSVRLDDKPILIQLLYTEVYVRSGEKWLLISRHANKKG
jgi:hypothetical protein